MVCLGSHSPAGSGSGPARAGRFSPATASPNRNALAFFVSAPGPREGATRPPGAPALVAFPVDEGALPPPLIAWTPGPVFGPTNVFFGVVKSRLRRVPNARFTASIAVSTTIFFRRSSRCVSS